jgi:O-acetyl-ADP-ribose deacetylase
MHYNALFQRPLRVPPSTPNSRLRYDVIAMSTENKSHLTRIHLSIGDLTESNADAIVNAANNDLILGGGVAGAIRRKGGEKIQRECGAIGSIPIGGAAITSGGNLKARHVIHAASMQLGGSATANALRSSTALSLRIASEKKLSSIAFPAIGTGIAGFPLRECAEIMLRETAKHLNGATSLQRVDFILFDAPALKVFQEVFHAMETECAAGNG